MSKGIDNSKIVFIFVSRLTLNLKNMKTQTKKEVLTKAVIYYHKLLTKKFNRVDALVMTCAVFPIEETELKEVVEI